MTHSPIQPTDNYESGGYHIEFEKFVRRQKIMKSAANAKDVLMVILIASIGAFGVMDEETIRQIIWYWIGFIALFVIACVIQDIIVRRKLKREGL